MNHYCTYFDANYLAQGLALWRSLARCDAAAILWVLALDENSAKVLQSLGEPRLRVVKLGELLAADPELAAAQTGRSRREFIFTLTPCLTRHLLRAHPEIGVLAYLDADLFFFADPAPVWRALDGGSVLLVAHRYPAWHDDSALYGRYNVGVLGFRDDANGRACLDWWRARCLESCALRADGVHYGDQKYLDEWPRLFAGIVDAAHPGVNVAPWNWAGHRFELSPDGVRVDGAELIVFHFAQFRWIAGSWWDSGQLEYGIMPRRLRSPIYGPYVAALAAAEVAVRKTTPGYHLAAAGWRAALGPWHLALLRLFWGQCWHRGSWWALGCGAGRWSGRFMGLYRRWRGRAE